MTKNEVIRELSKCESRYVRRLTIVYHNQLSSVVYTFGYENSPYYEASDDEKKELVRVLISLYKMRHYISDIHAVYYVRNSDGYFVKRVFNFTSENCLQYVYRISDFIKTIKK